MQYVNSVKDVKEEIDLHEDAKKDNIYKEDEYKNINRISNSNEIISSFNM
ncbi:hypothetical protein [Clostridioides difficile]|nr:hypothetical protein [Clostridioides difficile]